LAVTAALAVAAPASAQFRDGPRTEVRGIIKSVNAASITIGSDGREAAGEKTYPLAKDAEIALGLGGGARVGALKAGKVADLANGVRVALVLSADQKAVESILAEGPTVRGEVKAVDAGKRTITLSTLSREGPEEKTYAVAEDAEIGVDDGRGRRFSAREAQLADIAQGSMVTASLSLDAKTVQVLVAEGPTLLGVLKAIDQAKRSITVAAQPFRGEAEERTLTVANNATILIDDGRGRRLSVKEGKLQDVPNGSGVMVRLAPDQSVVMSLRAEGPTLTGMLKAVDADKGTMTLAIFKARGEEPEEKHLTVAKDARIIIDGSESQLSNLKAGPDAFVQVRLSLDQGRVQFIGARTQPR
jgi:hypothetical protein